MDGATMRGECKSVVKKDGTMMMPSACINTYYACGKCLKTYIHTYLDT
jgi:hypothetical protein